MKSKKYKKSADMSVHTLLSADLLYIKNMFFQNTYNSCNALVALIYRY